MKCPSRVFLAQSYRLVAFTNAYIIHTENFNNISLIIVCTDFWSLIDERKATYSKFNIRIYTYSKFIIWEAVR